MKRFYVSIYLNNDAKKYFVCESDGKYLLSARKNDRKVFYLENKIPGELMKEIKDELSKDGYIIDEIKVNKDSL